MSAQKFEKLMDLIINENQEQAEQLFHDIIVEKSREIYESIMAEEETIEEMGDELQSEEISEEFGDEEEFGGEDEGEEALEFDGEEEGEFDGEEEFGDEEGGEEDLEDRVVDLEEKLDQLMAEFEAELGGGDEGEDFGGEEEFGAEEGEDEEGLMEAAELKQIGGKTYDKFAPGGDNGAQTKSPGLQNPKRLETGGKATDFGGSETVPTAPKKPSNTYSKGEKTEDFGNINKVGGTAGKTAFKTKAPAPKSEDPGKSKSPVAESRTAKRRI